MTKHLCLAVFLGVANFLSAQTASDTAKYHLSTLWWQVGVENLALKDPYLSPLKYKGSGFGAVVNERNFFLRRSEKIISTWSVLLDYGSLLNPSQTASMLYLGLNGTYGLHYAFRPFPRLLLLAGGALDIDGGVKYLARNTNNPVNFDCAANLNASALAQVKIPMFRRVCQAELAVRTPLFGGMYVPQNGISYYEMSFSKNGMKNAWHISTPVNKYGYNANLAFDFPLNHYTIRLSGNSEYVKYKANNVVYYRAINSISIGCKYDFFIFSSRKRQLPQNFVSPND